MKPEWAGALLAIPQEIFKAVTAKYAVLDLIAQRAKAEKWNGALPTAIYAGAPVPFLNVGK